MTISASPEMLHPRVAVGAVVEGHLPDGDAKAFTGEEGQVATGIMVRMAAFVGVGDDCVAVMATGNG
jgi:hypothetical protein